jgi:hypothetical protein
MRMVFCHRNYEHMNTTTTCSSYPPNKYKFAIFGVFSPESCGNRSIKKSLSDSAAFVVVTETATIFK